MKRFILAAILLASTTSIYAKRVGVYCFFENSGIQIFDIKCILLLIVLMFIRKKYQKLHPIVFIVLAAVTGIIFQF